MLRIPKRKNENTKVRRDAWSPGSKMQLKHKINGRSVFVAKFKQLKTYNFDEVVDFVKCMRKNLAGSDVKTIQIGFELSNNQHYSGKMIANIDEDIDVQDFRNLYNGDYALLGCSICLS